MEELSSLGLVFQKSIKLPKKIHLTQKFCSFAVAGENLRISKSREEYGTQLRQWTSSQTQKPFYSSNKQYPQAPAELSLKRANRKRRQNMELRYFLSATLTSAM